MAASNGTITPPNPYTPTAFVPSTQTYATVGSLAVLLWDILLHLPQDFKLATQHRINLFFVIYCIARVTSLLHVSGVTIITTAAVENCDYFRLVGVLYPFAMPLTILPFVVRVFALYRNNKYVIAFFSMTWLAVLGSGIMMPIGVIGVKIGTKEYCLQNRAISSPALRSCLFIHDSFIFVATSWALMRNSYSDAGLSVKKGIRVMVLGKHLLPFSKSILRDGQAYYLIILIFRLVFLALPYNLQSVRTQCTIAVVLDYTISTSAINNALKVPSKPAQGIVFQNPTPSTKHPEDGDLEAGKN